MNLSRVSQLAILALFCFSGGAMAAPAHAIVEVKTGYVISATSNGKWLDSAHAAALLPAGTSFRIYGLVREIATATASKPESVSEPCPDTYSVKLSKEPEEGVIALAASWNALPRKPRVTDTTQPVYVQAVREFLEGQGVKDPKVKITQILRIDLDGDGEEEVLISATNYSTKDDSVPSSTPDGSYSCVLLRRVVAGKRSRSAASSIRRQSISMPRTVTAFSPCSIWTATEKWKWLWTALITRAARPRSTVARPQRSRSSSPRVAAPRR